MRLPRDARPRTLLMVKRAPFQLDQTEAPCGFCSAAANRRRRGDRTKRRWSYLLQEFTQMLAVDSAYEQAMHNLGQILGGRFSVDTAENINAKWARPRVSSSASCPRCCATVSRNCSLPPPPARVCLWSRRTRPRWRRLKRRRRTPGTRWMATVDSGIHVAMVWIMGQIVLWQMRWPGADRAHGRPGKSVGNHEIAVLAATCEH